MPEMHDPAATPDTPADSPLTQQDVMASPEHRDLSTARLGVGNPAFPFTLPVLDGHRETGASVTLGDYVGQRPVALIFGSYT